jgi:two-component system response regulator AtoC
MVDKSTLDRKHADADRSALGLELVVMANNVFARYPLPTEGVVVLGRGTGADVDVDDPLVSRRHARVHVGPVIEVEDLAGINGTFVGGRRLGPRERVLVEPGTVIGMGEAILIVQPKTARGGRAPSAGQLSDDGSSALSHIPAHIVIADEGMRRVYGLAALAARSPINVLVLGETGVGKELLAETVHACSGRAQGPFLTLNCATFSDSLLESELFGYEKGAFTGATQAKPGLLEAASGGTVFLDEVGEMAPGIQARLLRVLEVPESRRIGSLKTRPIDVRFVAATNRDLAAAVRRGEFRRDLFFRLNGLTLHVPPLRARRKEIRLLAARFVSVASRAMARTRVPELTAEALTRLAGHDWPGNVRELRNVVDRAVLLCGRHDIRSEHVIFDDDAMGPGSAGNQGALAPTPPLQMKEEVAALERRRIVDALDTNAGSQTKAARSLGMSRGTLLKRLDAYGLSRPRKPKT